MSANRRVAIVLLALCMVVVQHGYALSAAQDRNNSAAIVTTAATVKESVNHSVHNIRDNVDTPQQKAEGVKPTQVCIEKHNAHDAASVAVAAVAIANTDHKCTHPTNNYAVILPTNSTSKSTTKIMPNGDADPIPGADDNIIINVPLGCDKGEEMAQDGRCRKIITLNYP